MGDVFLCQTLPFFNRHACFTCLHPFLSLGPHTFSVLILVAIVKVVQQRLGSAEWRHEGLENCTQRVKARARIFTLPTLRCQVKKKLPIPPTPHPNVLSQWKDTYSCLKVIAWASPTTAVHTSYGMHSNSFRLPDRITVAAPAGVPCSRFLPS